MTGKVGVGKFAGRFGHRYLGIQTAMEHVQGRLGVEIEQVVGAGRVKGADVGAFREEQNGQREHWGKRLVQMNNVEMFSLQKLAYFINDQRRECHPSP
jgi:hypothetical protein